MKKLAEVLREKLEPLEDRAAIPEMVLDGATIAGLVVRLSRFSISTLPGRIGLSDYDLERIEMSLDGLARLALAMERNGIALGIRKLNKGS